MAARTPKTHPIEVHAKPGQMLGMPVSTFLRDYWQKRPLLIRGAFADFQTPLMPEDLAGLACEEGALSRLISHDGNNNGWTVRSGPFAEDVFPALPDHDWTLLVQDVDKWDPDVRALQQHFSFLPRWRMDDVMISFAATGGGVGAHVDQYDVFLLQAHGQRRWKIDASESTKGKRPPLAFRDDAELKLLRTFKATHDWVLAPGDMLYLPPNVPHDGVAVDPCLTFSFGMRAPSSSELLSDFVDELVADACEDLRYNDPDLAAPVDANEIDDKAMRRVVKALNAIRLDDPDQLAAWFGRFITTYRSAGDIAAGPDAPPADQVEPALSAGWQLQRHPWARLAWRRTAKGAALFFSGRDFAVSLKDAPLLAAAEAIDLALWRRLSAKGRNTLLALVAAGGYQLHDPQADNDLDGDEDAGLLDAHDADKDDGDGPELEVEYIELANDDDADDGHDKTEDDDAPELEVEITEFVNEDDTSRS
jgi:50S ribosomal protein L16 3-hydroxylase